MDSPGSTIVDTEVEEIHTAQPPPNFRLQETTDDESIRAATKPTGASRKRKEPPPGGSINPTLYSGSKPKHLKKDDGEPLWRSDIQYDFLRAVFSSPLAVFTNSYEPASFPKQTFADLYIDTMARSSKTSKILRDKLLSEHEPAKNMAMVCLLVNLGRMNTTLNFFPEMRAQLRTYHAIPSLQAHQDPNSYKQLQDAPRLKSILKGASEDRPEPNSLEKIKQMDIPRTNAVNLIFVLAQFAPRVTELHIPPGRDFYDLIMAENISSATRARAFLWLMWFYLESDFTEEGAAENPFGPGVDYDVNVRNQGVPRFEYLSPEQQAQENKDTPEEKEYGFAKMRERKRIIEADQAAFQAEHGPPKRGPKPKLHLPPDDSGQSPGTFINRIRPKYEQVGDSPAAMMSRMRPKYESDLDSTRSTPPPRSVGGMRIQSVLNTSSRGRGSFKHQLIDGSSPAPYPGELPARRSRPLTAHQLAVERNRNQRVEYILSRGLRKKHHQAKKERRQEGAFWRALQRTKNMPDPFQDSEDEDALRDPHPFREHGFGGLVQLEAEVDDFGEELSAYAAAFRRMGRRLNRWQGLNTGVIGTNRVVLSKAQDDDATEYEITEHDHRLLKQEPNGNRHIRNGGGLDDAGKRMLGIAGEADDQDVDEDLDDIEKGLLGIGENGNDDTEDEEEEEGEESEIVDVD